MTTQLIRNGTLIDGTGSDPITDGAVVIENGVITGVGASATLPVAGDVEEIDACGGYMLPGLIDTHVHLMFDAGDPMAALQTPFSFDFYQAIPNMRRTLDCGITSVRDAGGTDARTKKAVEDGLVAGPRMQISISVLSTTGGHGDGWHPAGVEFIKVCSTGGVMSATDHPKFAQYSIEELKVMVEEEHFRRGLKVISHAQGAEGIKNAIRAGIHSIEHGMFIDDEVIELMLAHDTFLVPTLVAPLGVIEQAEATGIMPDYALRKAKETIDVHRESIAKAYKAGVKIAMGTDAGVVPHGTNLRELGLMADIGMSAMDVLVATTKIAAECLGWQDRVGTLATGKLGDVVVTSVNPLEQLHDLANVENIALVIKGG